VVTDAARAVLHSIILTRSLGPLDAGSTEHTKYSHTLGVSYRTCGVTDIDKLVDDACYRLESALDTARAAELLLTLYDRRERSALFGLTTTVDRIVFEQWKWQVRLIPHRKMSGAVPPDSRVLLEQGENIRRLILDVAVAAAEETAAIPLVPIDATQTVPFGIVVDVTPMPLTPTLGGMQKSSPSAGLPPSPLGPSGSSPRASGFIKKSSPGVPPGDNRPQQQSRVSRSSSLSIGDVLDNVFSGGRRGSRS
jgi:hypothetical protein